MNNVKKIEFREIFYLGVHTKTQTCIIHTPYLQRNNYFLTVLCVPKSWLYTVGYLYEAISILKKLFFMYSISYKLAQISRLREKVLGASPYAHVSCSLKQMQYRFALIFGPPSI